MTHAQESIFRQDAQSAVLVGRIWDPEVQGPRVVAVDPDGVHDLSSEVLTASELLEREDRLEVVRRALGTDPRWSTDDVLAAALAREEDRPHFISPIDLQAIKACGVTFVESMVERVIEERIGGDAERAAETRALIVDAIGSSLSELRPGSEAAARVKQVLQEKGMWSQYLEVGIGSDPEVFSKAQVLSSVGVGAQIGVTRSSTWNNPEPELVLVVDSEGRPVGATLGNDVNLRDIEGRSALLLGKAKDNNASTSIGPFIRLFDGDFTIESVRDEEIALDVQGEDGFRLQGRNSLSRISRSFEELIQAAHGDHHQYPDGFVLYTGTLFAPTQDRGEAGKGFTHEAGDEVSISSPHLGTLVNRVGICEDLPPRGPSGSAGSSATCACSRASAGARAHSRPISEREADMTRTNESTTSEELESILSGADSAFQEWSAASRQDRARALRSVADVLDAAADELVQTAQEETRLAEGRLRSELKRTTFQLRLFGEVLEDGSYTDVRIDHADQDWPMGAPRPDLRRMLVPVGPTLVFAASNFPFAFSVAGGDTASALASGCSVVLKAHPGHPRLSERTGELVAQGLQDAGAPEGVFAVVFGTETGKTALQDPRIKAGAFTGSIPGGRALFDIAASRPEPIPFFGELGSINPVFVTQAADQARAAEIAEQFLGSVTGSAGQLCTKPGLLFVPKGSALPEALGKLEVPAPARLLNDRIQAGYVEGLQKLADRPGVEPVVRSEDALADPPAPTVLRTSSETFLADREALSAECFGPAAVVVEYGSEEELKEIAQGLEGQLTASIFAEESDGHIVPELARLLSQRAGRLLWNQWSTGVSVTYAQQHGGPYPATTAAGTTSVGTAAVSRFLRPVAYQNFPVAFLPEELREEADVASRTVDGSVRA